MFSELTRTSRDMGTLRHPVCLVCNYNYSYNSSVSGVSCVDCSTASQKLLTQGKKWTLSALLEWCMTTRGASVGASPGR